MHQETAELENYPSHKVFFNNSSIFAISHKCSHCSIYLACNFNLTQHSCLSDMECHHKLSSEQISAQILFLFGFVFFLFNCTRLVVGASELVLLLQWIQIYISMHLYIIWINRLQTENARLLQWMNIVKYSKWEANHNFERDRYRGIVFETFTYQTINDCHLFFHGHPDGSCGFRESWPAISEGITQFSQ